MNTTPLVKTLTLLFVHCAAYTFVWALSHNNIDWRVPVFGGLLVWISVRDIQTLEIPDTATFCLLVLGALNSEPLMQGIFSGLVWFSLFWLLSWLAAEVLKKPALGFGDVKLMGAFGCWLGLTAPITVTLVASLSGIATMLVVALARQRPLSDLHGSGIAFGPFLCLSAWAIWQFEVMQ